ncbi:enoyl-CoA hydratase-related protein [Alteraurantiacibacter buctensis]|uniref:enoyl-CoA hydratase-related protein n=1 Tax=Alteraurantiacibacter buctensis TaxID=1503981 RepID=UPI001926DE03|nr:enoyl-CoA hydratase-related protein [Alteraurantiacibacter buctensis]
MVREAQLNAIDGAMHQALRDALDKVEGEPTIGAVVLTGCGRAFSAGQDLGERAASFARREVPDLAASLEENYNPLVLRLANLPQPVIAAVNGMAFGAGAALAIACDIVLAARSARFQFGFVNVALGPDSGASWSLPRLVGQARALDLALTGRAVSGEEAAMIGLVSRVVDDALLADTANEIARGLAQRSPQALSAIKRQLRSNPTGTLEAALASERVAQGKLGATDAYRQAVLRFAKPRS